MRRTLSIVGATAALALLAPPPAASAGGGCRREAQTQGRGALVELRDMCMSPSVLLTEPGTTVRFVNRDEMVHNVFGEGWGTNEVLPGATTTQRFDAEGTYAFVCTLHPGMVGAITVGDGLGTGPVVAVDRAVAAATSTRQNATDRLALGLALGAGVGIAATVGARRLRAAATRRSIAN